MKIYVDKHATAPGNGSASKPFLTICDAATIAKPGDEVIVAPGVYREAVDPINGGTVDKPIVYRSAVPLGAEITGSEPVDRWEKYQDTVWCCRIDNKFFGDYNPYTTYVMGDWYFAPVCRHTGAVYLNGRQLYEAQSLKACLEAEPYLPSWESEFSVYQWYTEQEGDQTIIYANFQSYDPNREQTEINVRRRCFMPSKMGVNYITVSGFRISRAATTWAPPAAFQDGMIGPNWAKGWIIEDCDISNSKCCGISLGKYFDPDNEQYFTHYHVKSPTQMERDAVCRGQFHGWGKETVGSHTIRRCNIHHCEQGGIIGRMGCVFSIIEDNHIHHINNMQQLGGAEIAGIKLHAAIDVIIRRNRIHNCTMGIWCDWEAQGTRISGNLLYENTRPTGVPVAEGAMASQDIFIEVSHGPTLIDNNVMLSKSSVKIAAQGVALVHNLMLGALTSIGSGSDMVVDGVNQPRYTPYHFLHRTEVMGFMTMLHGDDRIFNNIFVQSTPVEEQEAKEDMGFITLENQIVGTSVFDDYPLQEEWIAEFHMEKPADMIELMSAHFHKLPVWINGNAYFNGAKAYKKEKGAFVGGEEVFVRLETLDEKLVLKTNLYRQLSDWHTEMICTDTLGRAFEPDQRFETSDGADIIFNQDFNGTARPSSDVLPGPFAKTEECIRIEWSFA